MNFRSSDIIFLYNSQLQNIQDELKIDTYETHARISLEKEDFAKFNQNVNNLKIFYRQIDSPNKMDFIAYQLLFKVLTENNYSKYEKKSIIYYIVGKRIRLKFKL